MYAPGGGTSRCDQPNVAAVCQTWNSAGTAYSACCGETSVVSYSAYSQGADNGLTILYENGDNCVICNPGSCSFFFLGFAVVVVVVVGTVV